MSLRGTALAKVYFPRIWRLSEDLDFAFTGRDFRRVSRGLESAFPDILDKSGIQLRIKSRFSNPGYLQLKLQYDAILGRNWVRVDATKEKPVDLLKPMPVHSRYSGFPPTKVITESLEEIFSQKLRALLERTKCRDFYDVWRFSQLKFNRRRLLRIFRTKCKDKAIHFEGPDQFLPPDLPETLRPYWERELGRLVSPLPDMQDVLKTLARSLTAIFPKTEVR